MPQAKELGRKIFDVGTKFLQLQIIEYKDEEGVERKWEVAERVNGQIAVMVIAHLVPSRRLILIKQYRPPARGYMIETPAGLVDEGEEPAVAGLRELKEETGYTGKILRVTPPVFNSAGMSGETIAIVQAEVDEEAEENQDIKQSLDPAEHIEVLLVKEEELLDFMATEMMKGMKFSAKVATYIFGLNRGRPVGE